MSDLTICNYCMLGRIGTRALEEGNSVMLRDCPVEHFPLGKAVFVYPKGTEGDQRFQSKYKVAWFVELSDHCVC